MLLKRIRRGYVRVKALTQCLIAPTQCLMKMVPCTFTHWIHTCKIPYCFAWTQLFSVVLNQRKNCLCIAMTNTFKSSFQTVISAHACSATGPCAYDGCKNKNPEGTRFIHIKEYCTAGRKNWEEYIGKSLCKACYIYFSFHGTMERKMDMRHGSCNSNKGTLTKKAKLARTKT